MVIYRKNFFQHPVGYVINAKCLLIQRARRNRRRKQQVRRRIEEAAEVRRQIMKNMRQEKKEANIIGVEKVNDSVIAQAGDEYGAESSDSGCCYDSNCNCYSPHP